MLKRLGVVVVFLGADGSGKSTVLQVVRPLLEQRLHSRVYCEHSRPNLLPTLAELFGGQGPKCSVPDPHASKPSGFLGSLVRLSYYTTDYIVGYWLKVFPSLIRQPCAYIFDRYFYDYYIDPRRSRIALPPWIVGLFGVLVPKPDIVLCLGADPEVIHARKPELPVEEIERQIDVLHEFCKRNERAIWIDTGCPVQESADQVLHAVACHMAARI